METVSELPVLNYYPFVDGNVHAGGKKLIGIKRLDFPSTPVFRVDGEFQHQLRAKWSILSAKQKEVCDVFEEDEGVIRACHEVLLMVVAFHERASHGLVRVESSSNTSWTVHNLATKEVFECDKEVTASGSARKYLLQAGALCQEDLCVMVHDRRERRWVLRAGCVAFPYDWHLQEKLGKDIAGIHRPVPGFNRVVSPVNKVFDKLEVGKPQFRGNHGVVQSDDLFYMNTDNAYGGNRLFLRVELQTLTKLKQPGCVLFSIRTTIRKLEALEPTVARDLVANMKAMPECLWNHRGYDKIGSRAISILTRRAAMHKEQPPRQNTKWFVISLAVLLLVLYVHRKRQR